MPGIPSYNLQVSSKGKEGGSNASNVGIEVGASARSRWDSARARRGRDGVRTGTGGFWSLAFSHAWGCNWGRFGWIWGEGSGGRLGGGTCWLRRGASGGASANGRKYDGDTSCGALGDDEVGDG